MKINCADLLTIGTGILCVKMERVYELYNAMTGDNLFTHQLPRAFRAAQPAIVSQYPWLKEIGEGNKATWQQWISEVKAAHGDSFEIQPLQDWKSVDPITEVAELFEEKPIVIAQ